MIRILKFFGVSFLFLLLLYILLLTLPYVAHKKVPQEILDRIRSAKYYSELPGAERAAYIDDNTDALLYRLNLIDQAEKEIIFSTFDFNVDEAGKDIMASLLSAAERGVRIRMLVDGFSGMLDVNSSPWFEAMASHGNIELKIYNPIHFYAPWKMQARLHDKYLIIDDQMYLLGGRNTFNLFLGDYTPVKNIDRELFIYETAGDPEASIHQLKQYFQSVWELPDAKLYTKMGDREKSQECIQWLTAQEVTANMLSAEDGVCMLPVPAATALLMKDPGVRQALDLSAEWDAVSSTPLPMGCIVARREFVEEHPEAVDAFLDLYGDSISFMSDEGNRSEAAELVAKYGITANAQIAEAAIPQCNLTLLTGEEMQDTVQAYYEVLYRADPAAIGGSIPYDSLYYLP